MISFNPHHTPVRYNDKYFNLYFTHKSADREVLRDSSKAAKRPRGRSEMRSQELFHYNLAFPGHQSPKRNQDFCVTIFEGFEGFEGIEGYNI